MSPSNPVTPPRLRPGDTIAVCAPAGPVAAQRLQAGLARLSARYRVRCDDRVYDQTGYLAGNDAARAAELNGYLADPDVRAIIMGRGGYGTMRILQSLDADQLRRDPKLVIGFSDGTALLAWALAQAGVRGVHGPVVSQLGRLSAKQEQWLYRLLESSEPAGLVPGGLAPCGGARGRFEGPLLGGNLCMLSHLVGTPYQPEPAGAVLFFEDIGERPYAVDRYLTHMSHAGALDGIACAVAGDFTDCVTAPGKPDEQRVDVMEVIAERFDVFGIPAARGLPVGHGAHNYALPIGARCAVDLDAGTLELLEPAAR